ncbi:MAG: hypothetical protein IMX02_01445 [Limnochordaceae bacterium]|nr:hypothetical protein [Limnochordaceae bacterium]
MKMEIIQEQLKRWGEVIVRTTSGQVFEFHLGDTTFDTARRVITFRGPDAEYVIDGDAIESFKMHWSHPEG